ncbi:MAG: hypothetical protein WBC91_17325, partial [Phototrophicaceae bacterium]
MTQPQKTEPSLRPVSNSVQAPPKFLLWGVIILFVLFVGGFFAGIWAFNTVLTTGQQVRVINNAPFMEVFLQRNPTPSGGVLPTVNPDLASGANALDLLTIPLSNTTATPVDTSAT